MNEKLYSFSSANIFPMKILLNPEIMYYSIKEGKVPSIHYQLNPTNKCNFNCPFCSCSERDRNLEMTIEEIEKIIKIGVEHGLKAVTITGGGEPLIHKEINEIIDLHYDNNVEVGIVTNGVLLYDIDCFYKIKWIRISASDILPIQLKNINSTVNMWIRDMHPIIEDNKVDWSFSYVLGEMPNINLIVKLIDFANLYDFTHIRIVNDIFIADQLTKEMKLVKNYMRSHYINDSIVNYQDRSIWTKGFNPCYISLLKPVIGADGYIYPCCGTQYALENPSRDYEKLMRMGTIENLDFILREQLFFDGSICDKCYYSQYNNVLGILMKGLKHSNFV